MTDNQLPYLLIFTVLAFASLYLLFPLLEFLFVRLIGAIIKIPPFLRGDIFKSFIKTSVYNWYVVLILVGLWFILFKTTVGKDIIENFLNQLTHTSFLSRLGSLASLFVSTLLLSLSIWVIPFFLFQNSYKTSIENNKEEFYISTKILAFYATIPFLLVTISVAIYQVEEKKLTIYSLLFTALYFILFWLFVWFSNRPWIMNAIISLYRVLRLHVSIYYITIIMRIAFWVLIFTLVAAVSITNNISPQYLVVIYLFFSGMIVFRLMFYTAEDGKDEEETLLKIETRVTVMINDENKRHSRWFYYPLFFVLILSVLYYYFIPSLEATNTLYILLIVLSFYIIYFDYLRNVFRNNSGRKKVFAFFGIMLFLSMPFLSPHNQFRIAFQEPTDTSLPGRTTLTEAVKKRLEYIGRKDSAASLYIVCAMGGGSRAGYISSETLRMIDSLYGKNSLWDRTVCYSTISGGSVGLFTYIKARELDKLEDSGRFLRYVYEKNYNSSGLYGLLIGDALETIFGIFLTQTRSYYIHQEPSLGYHDRNERLRREYDYVLDRASHLDKDQEDSYWLRSYYPRKHPEIHEKDDYFKAHFRLQAGNIPIHLVNTFEINNGRRAVLTPFPVGSTEVFPNALLPLEDTSFDSNAGQKDIRYREAVNLSELFPYISAASHIGTKSDHQFVDGGYYENYGISTAIDMYYLLKDSCNVPKDRIKLIMIKNSKQAADETTEQSVQLAAPLVGAMNAPFVGHANSLLESAKRLFGASNFCVIEFDADSSKVPLTRALTRRHIDSMRVFTDTLYQNQQLRRLLQ